MGYLNEFPHAKTWDSDLRQILEMFNECKDLPTLYRELKEFVNTYFTDLDVQNEINYKLDDMYNNGELSSMLQPFFNEIESSLRVTNARISNLVKLDDSEVEGYQEVVEGRVDYTGKEWDSIGDHVRGVTELLNDKSDVIKNNITDLENLKEIDVINYFEIGTINGNDGSPSYSNNRLRSVDFIDLQGIKSMSINIKSGYKYALNLYGENKTFIPNTELQTWTTQNRILTNFGNGRYLKVVLATINDDVISTQASNQIELKTTPLIVGEILKLKESVSMLMDSETEINSIPITLQYEVNTINGNNGETSYANNRLCSTDYIEIKQNTSLLFSIENGYKYAIHAYDENRNHIYDADLQSWKTDDFRITGISEGYHLRVCMANIADSVIQVNEANNLSIIQFSNGGGLAISKIYDFAEMYKDKANIDTYLFFTDMHTCNRGGLNFANNHEDNLNVLEMVSNSLPLSFVMNGGDWFNNNDTKAEFCFKFGNVSKECYKRFGNFYNILGNHDTNYQGISEVGASSNTGRIPYDVLKNLCMSDLYYQFNTNNASYYVLNTGLDWNALEPLDTYMQTQVEWFANKLLNENSENIVIAGHMLFVEKSNGNIAIFSQTILSIAKAFNNRNVFSYNGKDYDFSNSNGKVKYAIFGHSHEDYIGVVSEIPVVISKDATNYGGYKTPDCDLIMSDFDSNVLYLVRLGNGENRTINMA